MSIASEDRQTAFEELRDFSSETVTLNATTIKAIVNRGLDSLDAGTIDFLERDKSHVEFLKTAVQSAPQVGDSFLDSDGRYHRIKVVRQTDITWKCDCDINEEP